VAALTSALGCWAPGRVWLALGSNLPPQAWRWRRLLLALRQLNGFELQTVSPVWRNAAQGQNVQGQFFNAVAVGISRVGPLELLRRLKHLEKKLGRKGAGNRPADFDILCWQDALGWRNLANRRLQIPHRQARRRRFVLAPLIKLASPPPAPLANAAGALQRQQHSGI
jgi:2-amino-4-hydroxy-6-hydroxymethyldihydropteridine diphosphokinase